MHPLVSPSSPPATAYRPPLLPSPLSFFPDLARKTMVRRCFSAARWLLNHISSFYCIVLLTTLLISSCYWQPFSIDSPLSIPWSENITTFAEALNATLTSNYTKPLPSRMRVLDRCWCDLSSGRFFEPFNISGWEHASIQRMKKDLERAKGFTTQLPVQTTNATSKTLDVSAVVEPPVSYTTIGSDAWFRYQWQRWFTRQNRTEASTGNSTSHHNVLEGVRDAMDSTTATSVFNSQPLPTESVSMSSTSFKWLRAEYDLQPHGLGMVIDLRWS